MPKMKMRARGEDKEKIRRLRREIKDVKLDFEETFSVMEDMAKPEKKSRVPWGRIAVFIVSLLAGAAAAFFVLCLMLSLFHT